MPNRQPEYKKTHLGWVSRGLNKELVSHPTLCSMEVSAMLRLPQRVVSGILC